MDTKNRENERHTVLAPYLEQLSVLENGSEESSESGLPLIHPALALDPWEKSTLKQALNPNMEGRKEWSTLLAEGIAFQTKYLTEIGKTASGATTSSVESDNGRDQLIVNAAIGLSLMEETQRVIDSMVLAGRVGEAKKLSGFRNRLAQIVHQIKNRLGREAFEEAEAMGHEMVVPDEEGARAQVGSVEGGSVPGEVDEEKGVGAPGTGEKPTKERKVYRYSNLRTGKVVEESTSHSRLLLLIFATAVAAWLILILPRALRTTIPVLTLPDIPRAEVIREINARPPSLYLVVNKRVWREMSADARLEWVGQVSETAETAGYTGIHIQNDSGRPVAQWLKQKGAQLIDRPRGDS